MSQEAPRIDLVSLAGISPAGYPAGFVPRCPRCRYDLTGLKRSRCPECGAPFSIDRLYQAWLERKRAGVGDVDFLLAALFVLPALVPVNLEHAENLAWNAPVFAALWALSIVWFRRRRLELREPDEGHRLLWLWVPLAASAAGVSPTPVLGPIIAAASLVAGLVVMGVAWRRAPGPTSVVTTVCLAVPCAVGVLAAVFMIADGLSGSAQGTFWSASDYPGWYWRGVAGRARAMNNREAIRIGVALLGLSGVLLSAIVGLWLLVALRWRSEGAAPATLTLSPGSVPRRRSLQGY